MFAELGKHYPSRSGQTILATAVANITKPVPKNYFGPSTSFNTDAASKLPPFFRFGLVSTGPSGRIS